MGSWQNTDIDPNVLKRVTHLSNFENIPVKTTLLHFITHYRSVYSWH